MVSTLSFFEREYGMKKGATGSSGKVGSTKYCETLFLELATQIAGANKVVLEIIPINLIDETEKSSELIVKLISSESNLMDEKVVKEFTEWLVEERDPDNILALDGQDEKICQGFIYVAKKCSCLVTGSPHGGGQVINKFCSTHSTSN
jgi:hypothetical protein